MARVRLCRQCTWVNEVQARRSTQHAARNTAHVRARMARTQTYKGGRHDLVCVCAAAVPPVWPFIMRLRDWIRRAMRRVGAGDAADAARMYACMYIRMYVYMCVCKYVG